MLSSRLLHTVLILIFFVAGAHAQTADEIVAKYVEAIKELVSDLWSRILR